MSVDKLRLIEEVQMRPILWDFQNIVSTRNQDEMAATWNEVGEKLRLDGRTCRRVWNKLRAQFSTESLRVPMRIAKAKQNGEFDPNKKYYSWEFFDALSFVAEGRRSWFRSKIDQNVQNDSDMEIAEKNTVDQTESQLFDSSSYQTESDDDIKNVECDSSGQMKSEKPNNFENKHESGNDIKNIENNNFYQTQSGQKNYIENNILSKENINPSSIFPVDDSDGSKAEDLNFRSYTVSLNSYVPGNECATVANDTIAPQSIPIKEEPELQCGAENYLLGNNDEPQAANELEEIKPTISAAELSNCSEKSSLFVESNTTEHYDPDDRISNQPGITDEAHGHNDPLPLPEKHNSNSPGLNDEDYSFLYSFLSHTKGMTQLQNMEFRVNMKNLLVHIFPASASVNILEKQLLLPEYSDPDRKFLINFWPFLNSMSLAQNVQFRAKMANLVLQILSNEAIM